MTSVLLLAGAVVACDTGSAVGGARLGPAVVTERVLDDSDDPAIWVDRDDAARSLILGTDKHDTNGGVYVFGMNGRIDRERSVLGLQRMNNVDIVEGFRLGERTIDIALATERNRGVLRVFELPSMREIDGGGIQVFDGDTARAPMGVAGYTRAHDGAVFAIVGGKSGPREGYLWQYRLEDNGAGVVRAAKVRALGRFSGRAEIEAIAVDDRLGYVYFSDETVGIRKYHADPDSGSAELALFGTSGFAEDHEGIAIYARDDGTGYVLVSDQQAGRLQVFPREGTSRGTHDHPAIALVPVSAVDTDGIDVTHRSLGPEFPQGALVLMSSDGTFHIYRWEDFARHIDGAFPVTSPMHN